MDIVTTSSINLPMNLKIQIKLTNDLTDNSLVLYLHFRNFKDELLALPIVFEKKHNKLLESVYFPETLHNFHVLGSINHRSYWDNIQLVTGGINERLQIESMSFSIHYVKGHMLDVSFLHNTPINRTLDDSNKDIRLTGFIEDHLVKKVAGLDGTAHPAVIAAAKDIGKSGTSSVGYDQYGDNPKYGGLIMGECSETVSWYYNRYVSIEPELPSFKDILYTGSLYEIFRARKKTYLYNKHDRSFRNQDDQSVYIPKPGDFLARKGNGSFEHSMIMLNWDADKQIAFVIEGPYPVGTRTVYVHEDETNEDSRKNFIIGSIW